MPNDELKQIVDYFEEKLNQKVEEKNKWIIIVYNEIKDRTKFQVKNISNSLA